MRTQKPLLVNWFAMYNNQEIFRAFYEGVSANLSASNVDDGLGLYKRYHPNWYYQSADGVFTTIGTAGKTKTAANLDTAVAAVNTYGTTAKTIRALRLLCLQLKMPRLVTKSGQKYWVLLVHPSYSCKPKN